MTKVTILGQSEVPQPEKKKIEFKYLISSDLQKISSSIDPQKWEHIQLIKRSFNCGMDLMVAHDGTNSTKGPILYLGHFNDGVV